MAVEVRKDTSVRNAIGKLGNKTALLRLEKLQDILDGQECCVCAQERAENPAIFSSWAGHETLYKQHIKAAVDL